MDSTVKLKIFGQMNIRTVIAIYVTLVTVDAKQIFVSRQNDICDYYPQIKCSSDCSSLMVCHNPTSPPIGLKCPINQAYCANGKCGSETVNENCQVNLKDNADTGSFVCTSDGIFPDPSNCTNMYTCSGLIATKSSCSAGHIFNSKDNTCVRGTPRIDHASRRICSKISCENKPNGYILFPANPEFYAYCSNGSMRLYKCDVGENGVFDISANRCVFGCKSAGLFRDPLNCTAYYSCKGLIKFRLTKLYCADGHYFDGTNCVVGADCGGGAITDEPITDDPITDEPITDEPITDEPITDEPITDEPITDAPITDEPITDEPITDEPITDEPITDEPITDEPITDEPITDEPITDAPVTDDPITDDPITDEPITDEPITDEPITDAPVTDKPITDEPFRKSVPAMVVKDSTMSPFHAVWRHKGKYSYRIGKDL